ncbi:MAG TPA: hypothetical protein DEP42_04955 [Ruminococcaceae bacterium]|nr:hypothetical protein [Oscillospiraceae bacterium]
MGGHTSEGLAIYNSLKNNKAKIITYVDGFACSAASVAFMAGDERIMNEASILIVHNTLFDEVSGNGAQLRQRADELDKISQVVENAYAPKVNIDKDELAKLLDGKNHEGTILNPEEALKIGLATSIYTMEKTTMPVQSMQKKIFERIMANPQSCNNIKVDENRIIDGIVERLGKQFISKVPDTHKPVEENKQQKFLNALANRKD